MTFQMGSKKYILLFGVILCNLAVALESFGIIVSSKIIQGVFAVDDNWIGWLLVVYLFGLLSAALLQEKIKNHFNSRKRILIALFASGFLTASYFLYNNYIVFCVFRYFLGFFGGIILSHASKLLKDSPEQKKLPKMIQALDRHIYEICLGMSACVGGLFSQYFDWKALFYLEIIFYLLSWVIFSSLIKEKELDPPDATKVDVLGCFTFLMFCLCLKVYIGQLKEPWNTMGFWSTFSWIFLIATVCFGYAFMRLSKKEENPCLDVSALKDPTQALGVFGGMALRLMTFGPLIGFSTLFLEVYEYQFSVAGLVIGTFGLGLLLWGCVTYFFSHYLKIQPKILTLTGIAILSLSCFITRFVTILSEPRFFVLLILIYSFGISLILHSDLILVSSTPASVEKKAALKWKGVISLFASIQATSLIKTIIVYRFTYHFLIFSEQAGQARSKFFYLNKAYEAFSGRQAIPGLYSQADNAKVYLIDQLTKQAYLAGFADFCFLLGLFFLSSLVFFFIFFKRYENNAQIDQSRSIKESS